MSNVENSDSIPSFSTINRNTVIKNLVDQILNANSLSDYIYYRVLAFFM